MEPERGGRDCENMGERERERERGREGGREGGRGYCHIPVKQYIRAKFRNCY